MRVSRQFTPGLQGATPEQQSAAKLLRGRLLVVARATWMVVAALTVSLFVAGVPVEFALLHEPCPTARCTTGQLPAAGLRALGDLGLSWDSFAAYFVAMDTVFAAVWFAVAALIFWRRSDDRMGLFASLALLTFGTATYTFTLEALTIRHPAWDIPVAFLHFLGSASFGLFLYLFPDGRFVPRWTRWVALLWIAWQLPSYVFPDWYLNPDTWYLWAQAVVWPVGMGTALYTQAYRYRRISGAKQRQQIKLVVFGISSALSVFIALNLALGAFAATPTAPRPLAALLIGYLLVYAALLLIPLSIGYAILRHHLFDINLIINRTLVYAALTAGVVGLYVLVVGSVGVILQVQGNLLISILAAGLVAVMFQPLRERLQRAVNHLMYGKRDDPYTVLSQLGQRLEARLAPETALSTIVETIASELKLPYTAISLQQDDDFVTVAEHGEPVDGSIMLPLSYQTTQVGRLVLAPRVPGEAFSTPDWKLLEDLARQAAVTVYAARLNADLQKSRERLVTAREEERRRLRRDLHDGLGPRLAAQTLKVGSARLLYERDTGAADALLSDLESDIEATLSEIRRLVYDLRPPTLDELGLVGAIRETADRYASHTTNGLHVSIHAPDDLPPLSAAVEVAAYRIVQEALANVARHASATDCIVRLSIDSGLRIEVSDDGVGIPADHHAGVGLHSMHERAEELGGSFRLGRASTGGTSVLALLPLPNSEKSAARG